MWQLKNVFLEFLKKGPKRVFLDIFFFIFQTSFVILLLETYKSEYMLTIWKFKNVFMEFLINSISAEKCIFNLILDIFSNYISYLMTI